MTSHLLDPQFSRLGMKCPPANAMVPPAMAERSSTTTSTDSRTPATNTEADYHYIDVI
nr:hypothetical protein [Mycobacterium lepromatosis]